MKQSYEKLKKSQLELVEMNKKLIMTHQEEAKKMQDDLYACQEKLQAKSKKLNRYTEIVKTFDTQIEMFEDF